jgi:homoserine dehydrogenase
MEIITWPANNRDKREKIESVCETLRNQREIVTAEKLAYAANWTPRYAEFALQWYAGILNDARRGLV